jgi:malonate-semialdehyde dehydrogenase (acetylating)/methylmalonate-semialdehyde dehydrogenase
MVQILPHFIGGKHHIENNNTCFPVYNPAFGEVIAEVPQASDATCNLAVESSRIAFLYWSQTTPMKRASILFKFRELLEKNTQELAAMVTREHGKTLSDAKGSIARGIELVEWHCGLLHQLQGDFTANVSKNMDSYTFRQPLGVCLGVSPFNFPVMVPIWMMIPAISAGNTFILKPSEQAPSAPNRLLELLTEAGLPDGVVNCVHGDKSTVEYLLNHRDISAVTAVASTNVAESIYKTAIANGKRAHTFGGAKNHAVVMPDADMQQTAKAITGAAFGSAGERCMAISVVVTVGANTKDALLQHLLPEIRAIRVGAGDKETTDMGPLISSAHYTRVLNAVADGVTEGAQLLIDGRYFAHPEKHQGYYMGPCLFDGVTESMQIYQQEIFGPVLVIVEVDSLESALQLVNRHQYGNGTAIFTRDGYSAYEYSQRVQVGMVGVNVPVPVPVASHPFGGWKRSSFGDTNMHGLESIQFYTRRKTITSKWFATDEAHNSFAMPVHK